MRKFYLTTAREMNVNNKNSVKKRLQFLLAPLLFFVAIAFTTNLNAQTAAQYSFSASAGGYSENCREKPMAPVVNLTQNHKAFLAAAQNGDAETFNLLIDEVVPVNDVYGDDLKTAILEFCVKGLKCRHLLNTWSAPGRPKVEKNEFAVDIVESQRRTRWRGALNVWSPFPRVDSTAPVGACDAPNERR
jgi:hypothetical protein